VENLERGATQVAPSEGETLWVLGDLYKFLLASEDTDGAFSLFETTATAGLPGPPPYIHHREAEALYVLEGELELDVEGSISTAGAGSFVTSPTGTLHTWRNAGTMHARILGMVAPAGFEAFFEEVGEPAKDLSSPPAGPPDVEKVRAIAPSMASRYRPLQECKRFAGGQFCSPLRFVASKVGMGPAQAGALVRGRRVPGQRSPAGCSWYSPTTRTARAVFCGARRGDNCSSSLVE
jgi:mannose-6-phosphate isomerase-like protein (cupin superfamily)